MRRPFTLFVIYLLTLQLATAPSLAEYDPAGLSALRDGSLKKLVVHDMPKEQEFLDIVDLDGNIRNIAEFDSRAMVVNFFAVWCAPCRIEMPSLNNLQAGFERDDLHVVVVAVGLHADGAVAGFMNEMGIDEVIVLDDPSGDFSRKLGIFAIPTTIILDHERNEVARLIGEADWDSDSAVAIITSLIGDSAPG